MFLVARYARVQPAVGLQSRFTRLLTDDWLDMLLQMSSSVAKIVLGLVQVISKQPEVLKEDYPGIMWDSDWLKVFSFDFSWVVRSKCL